jgi:hypothetical protein
MTKKCRFGYTEKTCVEKDYPPCGDGACELPSRPMPKSQKINNKKRKNFWDF